MYLIWLIGRNTHLNGAVISATEGTAIDAVSLCREIIARPLEDETEDELVYRRIFPEVIPDYARSMSAQRGARGWLKSAFFIDRGGAQAVDPALAAYPCRMTSAARRVDLALFDDVMTPVVAASGADREAMIRAFDQTWIEGRLVDRDRRGKAVVIGNCYNVDSLEHKMRGRDGWVSIWLGVGEGLDKLRVEITNAPDDHPIFDQPEKYGVEMIGESAESGERSVAWELPLPDGSNDYSHDELERKRANNPSLFSRVYQLRATRPEDLMFPSWDSRKVIDGQACDLVNGWMNDAGELWIPREIRETFAISLGVDISSGKRSGNRIVASVRLADGRRCVLEVRRGNWSTNGMADVLSGMWERFGWRVVMVEDNATQDLIVRNLREVPASAPWRHTIVGWTTTGVRKRDEEIGLPGLDVLISNETYVWPEGDLRDVWRGEGGNVRGCKYHAELAELQREIASVPRLIARGTTPDSLMAWWFGDRGLARIGVGGRMAAKAVGGVASSDRDAAARRGGGRVSMRESGW